MDIEQQNSSSSFKLKRSKYYLRIDDVKDEAALLSATKYTSKLSDEDNYQESTKGDEQDDLDNYEKFELTTSRWKEEDTLPEYKIAHSSGVVSQEIKRTYIQNPLKPLLQQWRNEISH